MPIDMAPSQPVDFLTYQENATGIFFGGSMRVIAEGAPRWEVVFTAVRSKAARQSFRKWPLLANVVPGTMLLQAQTGGEADIQGSVTDVSGASIPYALITATNNATGVSTTRETSGDGLYTISPMVPGTYTVTATAPGFQGFEQENFSIDALKLTGLNISLSVGSENQQVTVTAAPPALENHQCRSWRCDREPDV